MNLHEAEQRLTLEQDYLTHATHAGNPTAIALAQAHVNYWQSEVFRLRLIEEGGWDGMKRHGERGRDYDVSGL